MALRSSENPPENPIEAMKDYFGAFRSPEWDAVAKLEQDIEELKAQNTQYEESIETLKKRIVDQKEINRLKEIERQQKLAEEEAKKAKKGGKK